ncbi:MAG: hypothetical protein ACRBCJ_00115 [Hyphomicrobiaceae bacterium]
MPQSLTAYAISVFVLVLSWSILQTSSADARRSKAKIAGVEVSCKDTRGRQVQLRSVRDLGDVGRAWVVRGVPFIVMDKDLLKTLPPKLRLFFYEHECAHHRLGHWYAITKNIEQEADCWAIKNGRDRKLFSRQDVRAFAPFFANSKGTRWGHLPGPQRAEKLLACYDEE